MSNLNEVETIGDRIKKIRRDFMLTQKQLGDLIGLKANSVALFESGKRNPSLQTIRSIARELGISEEWLQTGKGECLLSASTDSALSPLVERFDLSIEDVAIIRWFVELAPETRKDILDQLTRLLTRVNAAQGWEDSLGGLF